MNHRKNVWNYPPVLVFGDENKFGISLSLVLCMIFPAISACGKTLYVAPGGTGSGLGGWDNAANNIQAAINVADEPGDIVLVSNGVYNLDAQVEVNIPVKIMGFNASGENKPVINGQSTVRGFYIRHPDAVVADFMITNCAPADMSGDGGGVYMTNGLLQGCIVAYNNGRMGGGIYQSGGVLSNTTIKGNISSASGGAGLYVGGNARVYGGVIVSNISSGPGGGVLVPNNSMLHLENVKVCSNYAMYGGGVYVYGKAIISNCCILCNTASNGSGGGITFNTTSDAGYGTVTHSRVIGNIASRSGSDVNGGGINIGRLNGGVLLANSEISGNKIDVANRARGGGISATSNAVIRNCVIASNWVEGAHVADGGQGGGVYFAQDAACPNIIESCTIAGNYAYLSGGGVYLRLTGSDQIQNSIVVSNKAGATVNNIVFGDTARKTNTTYTCTTGTDATWGAGCTSADPLFAGPDSGNYRLQPSSPCINVGTNIEWMPGAFDLDGHSRLDRFARMVDMGCYEYVPQGALYRIK